MFALVFSVLNNVNSIFIVSADIIHLPYSFVQASVSCFVALSLGRCEIALHQIISTLHSLHYESWTNTLARKWWALVHFWHLCLLLFYELLCFSVPAISLHFKLHNLCTGYIRTNGTVYARRTVHRRLRTHETLLGRVAQWQTRWKCSCSVWFPHINAMHSSSQRTQQKRYTSSLRRIWSKTQHWTAKSEHRYGFMTIYLTFEAKIAFRFIGNTLW